MSSYNETNPFGYVRVSACVPDVRVADIEYNTDHIYALAKQRSQEGAEIIVFPELCVTAYTCGDLFLQSWLQEKSEDALSKLCMDLPMGITVIVGVPLVRDNRLYNCAAVIKDGNLQGIVPKTHVPNYSEFYEKRWFASGAGTTGSITVNKRDIPFGTDLLFATDSGIKFGIEICEDLWVPDPPSTRLALGGAEIIFNLSASDETIGKHRYLTSLVAQQSARCRCAYVYASAGRGESSTDLVFSGNAIIAEQGTTLAASPRFPKGDTELSVTADVDLQHIRHDRLLYNTFGDDKAPALRTVELRNTCFFCKNELCHEEYLLNNYNLDQVLPGDLRPLIKHPFVPDDRQHLQENCEEIISIQSWGLEQRLRATDCRCLIIGISGGLDSTLALLITCRAFDRLRLDRKGIIGITMPGEATSDRTHSNAIGLMKRLGITNREIPIGKAVAQHFSDIDQDPKKYDAAYENSQARERTQILMDMANKENGMVLGTGDLSELALGWCTYNGDQMSMYGVNASVPKTLVRYLVEYFANDDSDPETSRLLKDIIKTPISPELVPGDEDISQKTEDLVGPYELHDFFLYHTLRHGSSPSKIAYSAARTFKDKYTRETIRHWLVNFYRRFFSQQFKRSCMPDGPKVGSVCLSPRGDWRMPSDASAALWRNEVEKIWR